MTLHHCGLVTNNNTKINGDDSDESNGDYDTHDDGDDDKTSDSDVSSPLHGRSDIRGFNKT